MKKAIISTTLGAEGIDHTDGQDILLRDTPEDFAEGVVNTMDDADIRTALEREGRNLIEAKYDWKAVTAQLCDVFESVIEKTKAA